MIGNPFWVGTCHGQYGSIVCASYFLVSQECDEASVRRRYPPQTCTFSCVYVFRRPNGCWWSHPFWSLPNTRGEAHRYTVHLHYKSPCRDSKTEANAQHIEPEYNSVMLYWVWDREHCIGESEYFVEYNSRTGIINSSTLLFFSLLRVWIMSCLTPSLSSLTNAPCLMTRQIIPCTACNNYSLPLPSRGRINPLSHVYFVNPYIIMSSMFNVNVIFVSPVSLQVSALSKGK